MLNVLVVWSVFVTARASRPEPPSLIGCYARAVPHLDYALLCDYVRVDGGVAHVIGAEIDTVYTPETPTAHNFGLLAPRRTRRA